MLWYWALAAAWRRYDLRPWSISLSLSHTNTFLIHILHTHSHLRVTRDTFTQTNPLAPTCSPIDNTHSLKHIFRKQYFLFFPNVFTYRPWAGVWPMTRQSRDRRKIHWTHQGFLSWINLSVDMSQTYEHSSETQQLLLLWRLAER